MTAYYNEIDPKAAAWLRELIKQGHIADGVVDERSIVDVSPDELRGFTQCHFFAGIGVWSYALRSAGWADDRPVWTGSFPCQPFSSAGRRGGVDDERHLWPHWHHLISQCQPSVVFGEQVASKDGLGWLDLVSTDMEATGYAFGAADLCAAGVGAPHIRQRLFFGAVRLADANGGQRGRIADGEGRQRDRAPTGRQQGDSEPERGGAGFGLADAADAGLQMGRGGSGVEPGSVEQSERLLADGGLADADNAGSQGRVGMPERAAECASWQGGMAGRPSPTNGHWRDADWLFCRDGKWRPVSAKPQPLVDGSAESLGRVRDSCVESIKEEVNAWSMESKIDGTQGLRDLLVVYGAEAKSKWETGGIPGLCEAPFLLAFLRQLSEQGWREPECLPVSCEKISEAVMRSLWVEKGITGAPRQYGLEGQQAREYSDALLVLSSLLARSAREAWGVAYEAHAETKHPLASGASARVGRLRGYGNAIVAQAAQTFIESMMEIAE